MFRPPSAPSSDASRDCKNIRTFILHRHQCLNLPELWILSCILTSKNSFDYKQVCIHICMNIYSLWPESVSAAVTATRRLRPPWRWQWEEIRATWPQCSAASSSSWPARRLIGWATSAFSSSLLVRLSHTHTHTKHTHISLNHCLSCDESTVWRRQYLFYIYWSFGFCICSA